MRCERRHMRGNLKSKTGVVNCAAQVFVGQATKKYEDNRLTIFGASAARWPDFVSFEAGVLRDHRDGQQVLRVGIVGPHGNNVLIDEFELTSSDNCRVPTDVFPAQFYEPIIWNDWLPRRNISSTNSGTFKKQPRPLHVQFALTLLCDLFLDGVKGKPTRK